VNSELTILPDSVAIYGNIEAFDLAGKAWIDDLKLESLLVYVIDQVDVKALPALAEQFDVLGYKGWKLAATEADQRALIKKAIELHRFKGTRWAVSEAMKSIGFTDAQIIEHVSGHWANFKVQLFNQSVPITAQSINDLHRMIEEYKNTRSNLVEIFIQIDVQDEIIITDTIGIGADLNMDDSVHLAAALFYDGAGHYDGIFDHSGDSDLITFTPI
jgi:P2-related tail formation protein